jgi:hypothetical protein
MILGFDQVIDDFHQIIFGKDCRQPNSLAEVFRLRNVEHFGRLRTLLLEFFDSSKRIRDRSAHILMSQLVW